MIIVDHTGFPSFLYWDDDYDPDNLDRGLLRNDEYVKVSMYDLVINFALKRATAQAYRIIFASPSSASRPHGAMSTHCVAKLYELTEVTPGSLAYVAVLVSFNLCLTLCVSLLTVFSAAPQCIVIMPHLGH